MSKTSNESKKPKIVNPHKLNPAALKKDLLEPLIDAAKLDAKEKFPEWKESFVNKTLSKLEGNKVKVLDATAIKLICYLIELLLDDFSKLNKDNNKIYGAKTVEKKIEETIFHIKTID